MNSNTLKISKVRLLTRSATTDTAAALGYVAASMALPMLVMAPIGREEQGREGVGGCRVQRTRLAPPTRGLCGGSGGKHKCLHCQRKRGRPPTPMPEKIPNTPQNIARAVLTTKPKPTEAWRFYREWKTKRSAR